jgi:hypothetical protein
VPSHAQEGHILFTLPRALTLSTRTSTLPRLLGGTWEKFELGVGWAGLILCVLWEAARGDESKWGSYLETLPTSFDTPMFWADEELAELRGTAVVGPVVFCRTLLSADVSVSLVQTRLVAFKQRKTTTKKCGLL